MAWTTENAKRYENWTQEGYSRSKESFVVNLLGGLTTMWSLRQDCSMTPMAFLIWVVSTKIFLSDSSRSHAGSRWKSDLVHFTETGLRVLPDTALDSHGTYSGSAMQFDDKLFLFHTENVRDENWVRHPYQIGALLDKSGNLKKLTRS